MLELKEIEEAENITILTDNGSFGEASALYTHILRLRKKVTLVCESGGLDFSLSCVPWFDKVRTLRSVSSDLTIDMTERTDSLYESFKSNGVAINKKMATALYAHYLKKRDALFDNSMDGMVFAHISQLILDGAEFRLCNESIAKSLPISLFRLKSVMFKDMVLRDDARVAIFRVSGEDLKKTGSSLEEAALVVKEALNITHVETSILLDADNENKLLQLI